MREPANAKNTSVVFTATKDAEMPDAFSVVARASKSTKRVGIELHRE